VLCSRIHSPQADTVLVGAGAGWAVSLIASQLESEFNAAIAALPLARGSFLRPTARLDVADRADVLIVRPSADWRAARHLPKPDALWPGRLRWVFLPRRGLISIRHGCSMRRW
jgi:hypothetical protein